MTLEVTVTGAGGFFGYYVLREARTIWPDARITGVVRSSPQRPVDGVRYESAIPRGDVLFHLAGGGGVAESVRDPRGDMELNCGAAVDLLIASGTLDVGRVVMTSSLAVYGNVEGQVTEGERPQPVSPYGVSKLAAEHYLHVGNHLNGLDYSIARLSNLYGPGQSGLVIFDLAERALRDGAPIRLRSAGNEVRDFIHASDAAAALVHIARQGATGEVYNVGSGQPTSIRSVAETVARYAGLPDKSVVPAEIGEPGKCHSFYPSVARMRSLGWESLISIEEGISDTVEWIRNR
jgi:UDP-glucose 4-epimerase